MSYHFNPMEEAGISEDARLVLYNTKTKDYEKKCLIKKGMPLELNEEDLNSDVHHYKYKYQVLDKGAWKDATPYKRLQNISGLKNFLLGLDNENPNKKITMLYQLAADESPASEQLLKTVSDSLMRSIWRDRNSSHKNAWEFISYARKKHGVKNTLFGNLIVYLETYLKIKQHFQKHGLMHRSYKSIFEEMLISGFAPPFLNDFAKELEEMNTSLPFTNILMGKLESFSAKRAEAEGWFNNVTPKGAEYVRALSFDQGLFTYSNPPAAAVLGKAEWIDGSAPNNGNPFFLMSLDPRFLKLYGPQLFYFATILKDYHFHFHLVGEKEEIAEMAQSAFTYFGQLSRFMALPSKPSNISITTEQLPGWVIDKKTYYSCARFIHASTFMDQYGRDAYIMDADMVFSEDPGDYLASLQPADVAVPFTFGVVSLCPWRRMMAGNVYIKHNEKGHGFLGLMNHYFTGNLSKPVAWTLDQNALAFAYEMSMLNSGKTKFLDISQIKGRPLFQENIRVNIEKLI